MYFKLYYLGAAAYLGLAFDSLFKIDFGFQVHISVVLMALYNLLSLERKSLPLKRFSPVLFMWTIFLGFTLWGIYNENSGVPIIFVYLLVALNTSVFASIFSKSADFELFLAFQYILIVSGIFQFLLYVFLDYQIAFISPEHYQKGYSVSSRLRGFFIEPNWYAIALAFNTILLIFKSERAKFPYFCMFLTILVAVLNGTIAILGGVVISLFLYTLFKLDLKKSLILIVGLAGLFGVIAFRSIISGSPLLSTDYLNQSSRIIPILRVLEYWLDNGTVTFLFGEGVGSWGTLAIENNISALVKVGSPGVRDASELPVFMFEMGLIGVTLIILDLVIASQIHKLRSITFISIATSTLFFICIVFYPVLKFLAYMPYYFMARVYIYERYFKKIK